MGKYSSARKDLTVWIRKGKQPEDKYEVSGRKNSGRNPSEGCVGWDDERRRKFKNYVDDEQDYKIP